MLGGSWASRARPVRLAKFTEAHVIELETEQAELDACFEHCALALQDNVGADSGAPMLRFILIDGPVAIVKPYLTNNQPIPACVDAILRASHDAVRGWANRTD